MPYGSNPDYYRGTRGIGAELARHYAGKGVKKLVLMGVTDLPESDKIAGMLKTPMKSHLFIRNYNCRMSWIKREFRWKCIPGRSRKKKHYNASFKGETEVRQNRRGDSLRWCRPIIRIRLLFINLIKK
ncbi:hypothetical protein QNN00_20885 [Bacillus velezensis]|nr:hypothetical protein [Bacillus velezensis]